MRKDNPIGMRVFRLIEEKYTWKPEDGKPIYTIKGVVKPGELLPDGKTNDGWQDIYLLEKDGVTIPYEEYSVVFAPDQSLDVDYRLYKYLNDNGLYTDVYVDKDFHGMVTVSIEWGDWKHDHGWCRNLMEYLGYEEVSCEVTAENGSDTYSADHKFLPQGPFLEAVKAFRKASNQ